MPTIPFLSWLRTALGVHESIVVCPVVMRLELERSLVDPVFLSDNS